MGRDHSAVGCTGPNGGQHWPSVCSSLGELANGVPPSSAKQNCCHLQMPPHGGTKETERPPSSASVHQTRGKTIRTDTTSSQSFNFTNTKTEPLNRASESKGDITVPFSPSSAAGRHLTGSNLG